MAEEEIRFPDGRIEHPHVKHEKRDLYFGCIVGLILGAMGFAAVVHYILWAFFTSYTNHQNVAKRSPFPLSPKPSDVLPPEPRLDPLNMKEDVARADVYARQRAREALLYGVGRTQEAGYIHIPVERAIDMLAGKLPVLDKQPPRRLSRRAKGLVDGGGPNSGRKLRETTVWYER